MCAMSLLKSIHNYGCDGTTIGELLKIVYKSGYCGALKGCGSERCIKR